MSNDWLEIVITLRPVKCRRCRGGELITINAQTGPTALKVIGGAGNGSRRVFDMVHSGEDLLVNMNTLLVTCCSAAAVSGSSVL